jgi:hypothetical protein
MRKTDEISQPTSCLNIANSDERLFILLGRDPAAPRAVRAWAAARLFLGKNKFGDEQIQEALAAADAMDRERHRYAKDPLDAAPAPKPHGTTDERQRELNLLCDEPRTIPTAAFSHGVVRDIDTASFDRAVAQLRAEVDQSHDYRCRECAKVVAVREVTCGDCRRGLFGRFARAAQAAMEAF